MDHGCTDRQEAQDYSRLDGWCAAAFPSGPRAGIVAASDRRKVALPPEMSVIFEIKEIAFHASRHTG